MAKSSPVGDASGSFDLKAGQTIDLAASIEKSNFRNRPEIRLRIVDIKVKI